MIGTDFIDGFTNITSLHGDELAIDTSEIRAYRGIFINGNEVAENKLLDLVIKHSTIMMNVYK